MADTRHRPIPGLRESIRRSVALAWQPLELLRGSLRSNIVYGVEEVSQAGLREVQENALASENDRGFREPARSLRTNASQTATDRHGMRGLP